MNCPRRPAPDDLTAIRGIGPVIAARLQQAGILAMWRHRGGERDGWLRFIFRRDATPEEIAEALRELSESEPDDD